MITERATPNRLLWSVIAMVCQNAMACTAMACQNKMLWSVLLWSLYCYGLLYTNLFVRYLILVSKYHAEPPTLTRLGASADFLSTELTITYK